MLISQNRLKMHSYVVMAVFVGLNAVRFPEMSLPGFLNSVEQIFIPT